MRGKANIGNNDFFFKRRKEVSYLCFMIIYKIKKLMKLHIKLASEKSRLPCTTTDAFGKNRSDFTSPIDLCVHEIHSTNFVNDF